ncbi:hypothetical protein RN347_09930 [Halomonas sp. PAMB 3264]|uniref:hypothetical protein n=1 Tax=Halomonas sp. PAMB 3264 TaxID=3075222 RepID=UPI0028A17D59|nr:hypothetical protein [Halomonas sp. PAMB 3264]WNL40954.1 hypothetical protein RN347_09930 [Halomonas sp. PAMB 3264]
MKVVQIKEPRERRACLAKLCAKVYGQQAGLTPLVVFTGTQNVLFEQEAARLIAGTGSGGEILALALLVLDEKGEGMTLSLAWEQREGARARLISELSLNVPLKVEVSEPSQVAFYQDCGLKRWFDGENGERVGLNARHPATRLEDVSPTLTLDHDRILRRFKHDPKAFEAAKRDFLEGLERAPSAL